MGAPAFLFRVAAWAHERRVCVCVWVCGRTRRCGTRTQLISSKIQNIVSHGSHSTRMWWTCVECVTWLEVGPSGKNNISVTYLLWKQRTEFIHISSFSMFFVSTSSVNGVCVFALVHSTTHFKRHSTHSRSLSLCVFIKYARTAPQRTQCIHRSREIWRAETTNSET